MSTAIRATGLSAAGASTFGPLARLGALTARAPCGGRASGVGPSARLFRVSATVPSYQTRADGTNCPGSNVADRPDTRGAGHGEPQYPCPAPRGLAGRARRGARPAEPDTGFATRSVVLADQVVEI